MRIALEIECADVELAIGLLDAAEELYLPFAVVNRERVADLRVPAIHEGIWPLVVDDVGKGVDIFEGRVSLPDEEIPRLAIEVADTELHRARERVIEEIELAVEAERTFKRHRPAHLEAEACAFGVDRAAFAAVPAGLAGDGDGRRDELIWIAVMAEVAEHIESS